MFISPIFYTQPESWAALGIKDHTAYFPYLDQCVTMNCIGLILTFSTMLFVEFNRNKRVCKVVYNWANQISDRVLENSFIFFILAWYLIVFVYNGGLPLFNNGRSFYYDTPISPIYLALNEIIMIYAIYFGVRMIYHKENIFKFIIAVLTMLFSGGRGSVLVSVLPPIVLLYIYGVGKFGSKLKSGLAKMVQLIAIFFAIAMVGIVIGFVRDGRWIDIGGIITDLLYGNNFSDIRDGAFLLRGFERKFENSYWYGKTYFAGFMSFIPSRLSPFRLEWSYGRITTYGLFGWENHFGLRGGAVMEAYLNFGWFGVILFGIAQGALYAVLEKIFYYIFYLKHVKCGGKEFLIAQMMSSLSNFLVCTSGMYNIYVDILFFLFILILSKIVRKESVHSRVIKGTE